MSSGENGASSRDEKYHQLGDLLFTRMANLVGNELTKEEIDAEPSLKRIGQVHSGVKPAKISSVGGV